MPDESPLRPRFVAWPCDHCRNRIEFDAVQLAGRAACRVPCPHCGQETSLQEPPPPPPLIPDEGWMQPAPVEPVEVLAAPEPEKIITKSPSELPPTAQVANQPVVEIPAPTPPTPPPTPPPASEPVADIPAATPAAPPVVAEPVENIPSAEPPTTLVPKPIMVSLPPDPLPPTHTRAPADVRWLTDLGVVYFKQHQFGEAFLCFSRAAQQGFATAQFCLAVCYFNGHGTARDEAAALPWLRLAAAQGDVNAEFTLGLAYSLGRGVVPDAVLAAQWLRQAAAHGHPEAILRVGKQPDQAAPAIGAAGQDKIPPPPAVETMPPEKNVETRRHDLQRLVLGLFGKK